MADLSWPLSGERSKDALLGRVRASCTLSWDAPFLTPLPKAREAVLSCAPTPSPPSPLPLCIPDCSDHSSRLVGPPSPPCPAPKPNISPSVFSHVLPLHPPLSTPVEVTNNSTQPSSSLLPLPNPQALSVSASPSCVAITQAHTAAYAATLPPPPLPRRYPPSPSPGWRHLRPHPRLPRRSSRAAPPGLPLLLTTCALPPPQARLQMVCAPVWRCVCVCMCVCVYVRVCACAYV